MAILREVTKEKGHKVWDETHAYQYWQKRNLYDSLPLTMNRIAKESRKNLKNIKNIAKENEKEDEIDIGYNIGNQSGLFRLENDLKMILWDIYCKINHIPTKNKILDKIDLLCSQQENRDVQEDYWYRNNYSLLEELINETIGYHWSEEENKYGYYDKIIDNNTLYKMNEATTKEKMEFCIKEYRKTIKFIQKCLDENDIECEIVGDCYLDSHF